MSPNTFGAPLFRIVWTHRRSRVFARATVGSRATRCCRSASARCVVRDSNSGHQLLLPPANWWCPVFASRATQVSAAKTMRQVNALRDGFAKDDDSRRAGGVLARHSLSELKLSELQVRPQGKARFLAPIQCLSPQKHCLSLWYRRRRCRPGTPAGQRSSPSGPPTPSSR